MPQYWISYRSLTHAQRAARILERKGLTAVVSRLPQGVSPKGCGYALIIRHRINDALFFLRQSQLPGGIVFEKTEAGEFQEVSL